MIESHIKKLIDNLPHLQDENNFYKNNNKPITLDLVLDGGIFNGSYLIGALLYLKEMEKRKYVKIERISGCSIGSLVAFIYLIDKLELMEKLYGIFFSNFKNNYKLNKLLELELYLNEYIPNNICDIINNKLYITYHNIKKNKKIIKKIYKSKREIIDTIIKSCFVPYLINGEQLYKNKYIDGINPYIFDNDSNNKNNNNKKILYLDLFGYDKINNLINVKNEKTNYHRILSGVLDIHLFFLKSSSTPMCSYIENWTILNNLHIQIKLLFEKIFIYFISISIMCNKYICGYFTDYLFYKVIQIFIYDLYIILLENYCV
jgi:hypothetical protein